MKASSPLARRSTTPSGPRSSRASASSIGDEVEKVSWWTTNALSAKTKRLDGVKIPPNTREFIVGVQNWVLNP